MYTAVMTMRCLRLILFQPLTIRTRSCMATGVDYPENIKFSPFQLDYI